LWGFESCNIIFAFFLFFLFLVFSDYSHNPVIVDVRRIVEEVLERRDFITGDCEDKRILMHDNIDTKKQINR